MTRNTKDVDPLNQERRKPYHAPTLRLYGDIQRITQSKVKGAAVNDGGSTPAHKTNA